MNVFRIALPKIKTNFGKAFKNAKTNAEKIHLFELAIHAIADQELPPINHFWLKQGICAFPISTLKNLKEFLKQQQFLDFIKDDIEALIIIAQIKKCAQFAKERPDYRSDLQEAIKQAKVFANTYNKQNKLADQKLVKELQDLISQYEKEAVEA